MNLETIIKKKESGQWFEIPGDFFEKEKVQLLLKPISQDDLSGTDATVKKFNKKTHMPYDDVDRDKRKKNIENLLFESTGDWKNIDEEFNRENYDKFINNLGAVEVGKDDDDEKLTLSGWITKTCLEPSNFFNNDIENL